MAMKVGDVIEFDYELRVEGHEGLYDTTIEEKAKEAGIAQPNAYYAPMRYLVGAGRLIPGLEDALLNAQEGKTFEATFPPEQAYGQRDPALVETIPMKEFKKANVEPKTGLPITWRNRRGVVTTVGGGRVRVDFNPGLAGKALTYRVTVRKVYREPAQRVVGLFLMNYPSPDEPRVTVDEAAKVVTVDVPEACKYDPNWVRAKLAFLSSVRRNTEYEKVRFQEDHVIDRTPPPEVPAESSTA